MTPINPTAPLSVIKLYNKFRNLVGLIVTQSMVYLVLLVSIFASFQLATINAYAQDTGETNIIGSIGFKECNFVNNTGKPDAAVVTDVDAKFQKCIGSIIQFFFALALFIIAVRIGIEALANVNPAEAGKAVASTITLVRDVTVGLLLIGSPGIFLSFLNPTTLSLAGVINFQRLRGPATGEEAKVDSLGRTDVKLEGGGTGKTALEYGKINAELAAELLKDPDKFARDYNISLNVIKENVLSDLKSGKIDFKDPKNQKNIDLLKWFVKENGGSPNAIIDAVTPGTPLGSGKYSDNLLLGSRALPLAPFTLTPTGRVQSISGGQKRLDYRIGCKAENGGTLEIFSDMCDKVVGLVQENCNGKAYMSNSNAITSSGGLDDSCLKGGVLRDLSSLGK